MPFKFANDCECPANINVIVMFEYEEAMRIEEDMHVSKIRKIRRFRK